MSVARFNNKTKNGFKREIEFIMTKRRNVHIVYNFLVSRKQCSIYKEIESLQVFSHITDYFIEVKLICEKIAKNNGLDHLKISIYTLRGYGWFNENTLIISAGV